MKSHQKAQIKITPFVLGQMRDFVSHFHKVFEHPIYENTKDEPVDQKMLQLRASLIREEVQELYDAIAEQDHVEVADAIADIVVVALGAYVALTPKRKTSILKNIVNAASTNEEKVDIKDFMSHDNDFVATEEYVLENARKVLIASFRLYRDDSSVLLLENFNRVMLNNMTKLADSKADAEETIGQYAVDGIECGFKPVSGGKYAVIRTTDGKLMKQINWKAPVLAYGGLID